MNRPDQITPPSVTCGQSPTQVDPALIEVRTGRLLARPRVRWLCVPGCGQVHQASLDRALIPTYVAACVRTFRDRRDEETRAWAGDTGRWGR